MSDSFQVDDIAVCIDNKPDTFDPRAGLLVLRQHYRVATVGVLKDRFCIGFRNLPSTTPGMAWGFQANRFRKLPKADESFIEQVRACRPHDAKTPVEA